MFGIYPAQIAIDQTMPDVVYAASIHKIRKTVNGGLTWVEVAGGGVAGLTSVVIDPFDRRTIFIGVEAGWGVYESTDGAASFGSNPLMNMHASALAFHPDNARILYAGGWDYQPGERGGVWKSEDGGSNWRRVMTSARVRCLLVLASGVVFAGTDTDGLQQSTDGSAFARVAGLPAPSVYAIAVDPQDARRLYAGTWEEGVYRSLDGGGSWEQINAGLLNTFVISLIVDPGDPRVLYAGTKGGGIFKWY